MKQIEISATKSSDNQSIAYFYIWEHSSTQKENKRLLNKILIESSSHQSHALVGRDKYINGVNDWIKEPGLFVYGITLVTVKRISKKLGIKYFTYSGHETAYKTWGFGDGKKMHKISQFNPLKFK